MKRNSSKKKKLTVLLAAGILASILMTACSGSSDEESSEETTVEESVDSSEETTVGDSSEEFSDTASVLEDGVYTAEFNTDSSMFHVNETCDGMGTLTVENGEMTIHVSLVSQNIVNLYVGLAEDASADGAELLEPTVDTVTYDDGISEEVYGFDIPVPAIDEDFSVAIIGTKGVWYDHTVSVSNPEPADETTDEDSESTTEE